MAEEANFSDGVQILAIGSSSTEGVGASSPANTYPSQLETTLEALFPGTSVEVQNAGIGGETADTTVARLENALNQPRKPDFVIWQVGTNDAVRGGNEGHFRALLERGVAAARRNGVDLILLDQQFYPTIPDLARYERYVQMVGAVAETAKVGLFSRFQMMKEWAAASPGALTAMLSKDRFHMGDEGYRCLAKALGQDMAAAVAPVLARSVSMARARPAMVVGRGRT
jgi:lysophospholipase L1-like esterase